MDTNQPNKDHNNTKPIWKTIVLCNTPRFKLKSKKAAKNKPSLIVIPNETAKKFPKYRFQPTLESAFQHSNIETQVQHAPPKKLSKKSSLFPQKGKTHASRRSQLLCGTAETTKEQSRGQTTTHDNIRNQISTFRTLKQQLNGPNRMHRILHVGSF